MPAAVDKGRNGKRVRDPKTKLPGIRKIISFARLGIMSFIIMTL